MVEELDALPAHPMVPEYYQWNSHYSKEKINKKRELYKLRNLDINFENEKKKLTRISNP